MSTTIYDSDDACVVREDTMLSIDVTHETVWFFEHDAKGDIVGKATVPRKEMRDVLLAISENIDWIDPLPEKERTA